MVGLANLVFLEKEETQGKLASQELLEFMEIVEIKESEELEE